MMDFDEFVANTYDSIVTGAGEDGIKANEARDMVRVAADKAVADGHLKPPGLDAAVAGSLKTIDTRRRQELPAAIVYAASALDDETILGPDDPSLNQAFPVGTGIRKALRYCNAVDLDEMVSARRQNMASIVAAFNGFAENVDRLKATMRVRNARIVLDLFGPGGAS